MGIDVLPRHFYSQVPNIRELRQTNAWRRPYSMETVSGSSIEEQLDFVRRHAPSEIVAAATAVHGQACELNEAEGYGPIEAQFLYCFACTQRPRTVIQVGAGVSTAVLLLAADTVQHDMNVVCIDPFPTRYLRTLSDQGKIRLLEAPAQEVEEEAFDALRDGDLLFVDSTHTVGPGSEVNRLVLETLPRLAPGVFVHFHDITFPYDYSPGVLDRDLFFWSETVLLLAFLTCNPEFRICAAFSMLHDQAAPRLQEIFPSYRPELHQRGVAERGHPEHHFPSSAFLRRRSSAGPGYTPLKQEPAETR